MIVLPGGAIRENIRENDNVTFDVQDGKKGSMR